MGVLALTDPGHAVSEKDTNDVDEIEEVNVVDELLEKEKDATGEKTIVSLWTEEPDILCVRKRDHTQIRKFHLVEGDKPTRRSSPHRI